MAYSCRKFYDSMRVVVRCINLVAVSGGKLLGGALFAGIPLFKLVLWHRKPDIFSLALPYWYYLLVLAWILAFWVLLHTAIDFKFSLFQ